MQPGHGKARELAASRAKGEPVALDDAEAVARHAAPMRGRAEVGLLARADDHAGRGFGEEKDVGTPRSRQVEPPSEAGLLPAERALREGHGEAAVRAVVGGAEPPRGRGLENESVEPLLRVQVQARDLPGAVPLELSVAYRGGRTVERVELEPAGGSWTLETPAPPGKLEVNGDRGLLVRIQKDD